MRTAAPLTPLVVLALALSPGMSIPSGESEQAGKTEIRDVFDDVQRGISQGNVAIFSPHIHSQVRVTLHGGETGLYSANQAYYLLQNFLRDRKPVNFAFTTYGESESTPYGTGNAAFTFRGVRQHAQVYVALASEGGRWVIMLINIY
jgi:Domain of unknown function (DUF4783)